MEVTVNNEMKLGLINSSEAGHGRSVPGAPGSFLTGLQHLLKNLQVNQGPDPGESLPGLPALTPCGRSMEESVPAGLQGAGTAVPVLAALTLQTPGIMTGLPQLEQCGPEVKIVPAAAAETDASNERGSGNLRQSPSDAAPPARENQGQAIAAAKQEFLPGVDRTRDQAAFQEPFATGASRQHSRVDTGEVPGLKVAAQHVPETVRAAPLQNGLAEARQVFEGVPGPAPEQKPGDGNSGRESGSRASSEIFAGINSKQAGQSEAAAKTGQAAEFSRPAESASQFSPAQPVTEAQARAAVDQARAVTVPELNHRLIQEIRQFQLAGGKDSQTLVQLKLVPEHLGQITVKLIFSKGEVNAHFYTGSSHVKELVEGSLQQLREAFSQQDLKLNEAIVFSGSEGHGGTNLKPEGEARGAEDKHQPAGGVPGETAEGPAEPGAAAINHTRVDCLV